MLLATTEVVTTKNKAARREGGLLVWTCGVLRFSTCLRLLRHHPNEDTQPSFWKAGLGRRVRGNASANNILGEILPEL